MFRRFWVRLALAGSLLAVLVLLFALPSTRWLFLAQLGLQVTAMPIITLLDWLGILERQLPEQVRAHLRTVIQKAAEHYPKDYLIQLAATLFAKNADETLDRLRALIVRFPDEPSLYAAILRYNCRQYFRLGRKEDFLLYGTPVPKDLPKPQPKDVAAFEQVAAVGEHLDPDNAFFTMMRATALFAAHRDREALAVLQRASRKQRWNDYMLDEAKGTIRLYESAFGRTSGLVRASLYRIVLAPHLMSLRTMAKVASYKAIKRSGWDENKKGSLSDSPSSVVVN